MLPFKGRIARLVVLGTTFVALSGLPAYAAPAWSNGNHQGWGNRDQAQNSCNGNFRRQGRPQDQSCGWNGNQNGNQWNGGGSWNEGAYPPGQVNGMSWQAAGYSPAQAWAVYSGPGGGSQNGYTAQPNP
ncbi:MAG TPA: hypothetical protein VKZ50_05360 [bacterium]|nr:hypothetical protein [bacterium]